MKINVKVHTKKSVNVLIGSIYKKYNYTNTVQISTKISINIRNISDL